jgi:hypothetical protein
MNDLKETTATEERPPRSDPKRFEELERQYIQAKTFRQSRVEDNWRDVVSLVLPEYGEFSHEEEWPDVRFDSIGTECTNMLADGMFGNLTPSSQMWFRYQFAETAINSSPMGGSYLEELTQHMVGVFNRSTYYDVGPEFLQLGIGFGTASMDIHEDKTDGIIVCRNEHPRAVYVVENSRGQIRTVFIRKFFTAPQAEEEYGRGPLPESIITALNSGDESTEFEFIEVVTRNPGFNPEAAAETKAAKNWPFREEVFIPGDSREMIIRTAYVRTFSKPTWRWKTRANNPYGWAPVTTAMPDIRTANQIVRTWLLNLQKAADPATFDPEEGRSWNRDPGARNYYRDPNRRGFKDDVPPMSPHIEQALDAIQKRVRQALKVDAFLMLLQLEAQMTAREIVERKREGMTVVSATLGKFETEALDQIHARFLSIEAQAGRLPPLPKELNQTQLKVEYLGPISQMQREIYIEQGIVSAIETATPVFTLWRETLMKIKPSLLIDRIWRANVAPEDALRSEREYEQALTKQAQAAQQAAQQARVAELGAKVDPNMKPVDGSPASALLGGAG